MGNDLVRLLGVIWMGAMVYFMYYMWVDLGYMTEMVHAYMKMMMEHIRH